MAKDYRALADSIYKLVGGSENINSLSHCMTRLHFDLKDESLANAAEIEKVEGVLKVIPEPHNYMVIIGTSVVNVYKELVDNYDIAKEPVQPKKKGFFSAISAMLSGK